MRIISNDPEVSVNEIRRLNQPKMFGKKWLCEYFFQTYYNTKIYFTGIKEKEDINKYNFSLVLSDHKADHYVLAPDLVDPQRPSTLTVLDFPDDFVYDGVSQGALVDMFHMNMKTKQLVTLYRPFPELFDYSNPIDTQYGRMYIYGKTTECFSGVEISINPTLSNTSMEHCQNLEWFGNVLYPDYFGNVRTCTNKFVMHIKSSKGSKSSYFLHPATRYVIPDDHNTIIVANPTKDLNYIQTYLNNDNIPQVSIMWFTSEEFMTFIDPKVQFESDPRVLMIGYTYEEAAEMRKHWDGTYWSSGSLATHVTL